MARSTYIYIIKSRIQGDIWAAFTVKHELESWIDREKPEDEYDIYRVRDNKREDEDVELVRFDAGSSRMKRVL